MRPGFLFLAASAGMRTALAPTPPGLFIAAGGVASDTALLKRNFFFLTRLYIIAPKVRFAGCSIASTDGATPGTWYSGWAIYIHPTSVCYKTHSRHLCTTLSKFSNLTRVAPYLVLQGKAWDRPNLALEGSSMHASTKGLLSHSPLSSQGAPPQVSYTCNYISTAIAPRANKAPALIILPHTHRQFRSLRGNSSPPRYSAHPVHPSAAPPRPVQRPPGRPAPQANLTRCIAKSHVHPRSWHPWSSAERQALDSRV